MTPAVKRQIAAAKRKLKRTGTREDADAVIAALAKRPAYPEPRVAFAVPLPPSTNHLYANRPGGRVITGGYQRWLAEAGWALKQQYVGRQIALNGRIGVRYDCERPSRRRDLGNVEKPLSDLLVKQRIIRDDRDIEHMVLTWSWPPKDKDRPMARIEVWEIEA